MPVVWIYKNLYRHDRRADKNPKRHDRRADKNPYRQTVVRIASVMKYSNNLHEHVCIMNGTEIILGTALSVID